MSKKIGFEILIEKEWCYFGYPFALRFGLNLKKVLFYHSFF